jgi:hypothetical protein
MPCRTSRGCTKNFGASVRQKETELCPCGFGIMISTPGFCHNFEVGFGINLSDMDFPDVRLPEMGLALLEEAWSWAKA